ncbi:MAG: beta-CASP ribonuclease aCPSF1 [Candidatus Diapherotrites archaeon]|nr:beta-CASP ribonuclease aCPSF1 [Candidatus Diapherotrites archaeon]
MPAEYLERIEEQVKALVPPNAMISAVSMEGPEIVIYTRNPRAFFEGESLISAIVSSLKKRVNIRSDPSLLMEEAKAERLIREMIPEGAGIKSILFNHPFSEVVIEALKLGLVIGKGGETSRRIILETGWSPTIIRAPTGESEILDGIRYYLHKYAGERKKFLERTAQKIYGQTAPSNNWFRLTALGAFREVGRSCLFVESRITKTLLDCGLNVASRDDPYPYLESLRFPLNELDAVVLSHAHLDHVGMLPYLFKMGYDGPVYCTAPTRDLSALLTFDLIDVMTKENAEPPYGEKDVREMAKHMIIRDYLEVTDIAPDMRLTLHNAAHMLGSASVHLNLGEGSHNLLYSADIKYGFTRLFDNIELNIPRIETLVLESTYGAKEDIQAARPETEERFLKVLKEVLDQEGNVLIPVFAVGRAQELMLVIENFYRRGLLSQDTRVLVDGMTKQASAIHTAYPEYLRETVQKRVLQNDSPFTSELFKTADPRKRDEVINGTKNIIIASSGMLTGGPSLQYFYGLAEDPRNAIFFVGWQSEGALGRKIQQGVPSLPMVENGRTRSLKINMRVESFEGFSGHSDRLQLVSYVKNMRAKPKRIFTNHGEKSKCIELAKHLSQKFNISSASLSNLDAVRLR